MIDTTTQKPLFVSTGRNAGPYIMVPVKQLDQVRTLLDANNILYWVDEQAISLDGKPEITFVNLRHETNPDSVQHLLDSIS
jgi:hypothetical protein